MVAVAGPFMPVPIVVVKSYDLPDFVGPGSLVFALSFSGDTEETWRRPPEGGRGRGQRWWWWLGGELARPGRRVGCRSYPCRRTSPSPGPPSGPWPSRPWCSWRRSASSPGPAAVGGPGRRPAPPPPRRFWSAPATRAEELARDRAHHPARPQGPVPGRGRRPALEGPVNENAKCPAFFNVYPELCHNELAGWGQHGDATRQLITLVNLRHDAEHPQVSRRFDLVADVLREVVADIVEVRAEGEGDLAQLLDLALVGDFVSLHLAGTRGSTLVRSRCWTRSSSISPQAGLKRPRRFLVAHCRPSRPDRISRPTWGSTPAPCCHRDDDPVTSS
jgi:glucose/mannose-6-phosphate isomerase